MRFGKGAIFRRRAFCPVGASEAGTNVTGLDCGLGVLKTWRPDAVAGTESRGARVGAICITVPRMRAGRGAGKGMTVMAATAANESTLPREREPESSRTFILEKRSTSPSMSNGG